MGGIVTAHIRGNVIENLERRRLLSLTLQFGTLTVAGTAGNDKIVVSHTGNFITAEVNGASQTYSIGEANPIIILGRRGNDDIQIFNTDYDYDPFVTIWGDAGDDVIRGGVERAHIFGGDGDDTISGGDGRDTIYGQGGDDFIRGDGGSDFLVGEDGNDLLRGDKGNDYLSGDANSDRLRGSAGNDELHGGGSRDFLAGEDGDDACYGGPGDDVLSGGDGADYCIGEIGNDNVHGGNGNDTVGGFGSSNDFDVVYGDAGSDLFDSRSPAHDFKEGEDQSPRGGDIYYWGGDANLDGTFHGDDYGMIDSNGGTWHFP